MVDAARAVGPRTAMGRYVERMAWWWSRSCGPFDRIVLLTPSPVTVADLGTATPVDVVAMGPRRPALAWEQVALPARAARAALLFCPSYTCPLAYPGRIVVANHGIYEALPDEFSRRDRLRATPLNRWSARRAQRVIVNSRQTASDLARFFGVRADKVDVVYPAAAEIFFADHDPVASEAEVVRAFGASVPYVLFVGKMAKRRNVPNLIRAFSQVVRREALPHHLLLVGPNTAGVAVDDLAAAGGVSDLVTWLPHLEQDRLAHLYARADVFTLPTTYEGISWTMFEAMASGTAVLTVDHPTLAEGAADAAYVVASPSVSDIEAGLTALLTDAVLRSQFAAGGRQRAEQFSWQHAATQTMAILDRAARARDGTGGP